MGIMMKGRMGKSVPRSLSEEKYPMLRDPPMERTFRFSEVDMSCQGGFKEYVFGRALP